MRGGLERWKRGADSHGVHAAIAYALDGECDSGARVSRGVEALADYSDASSRSVTRFTVEAGEITTDRLDRAALARWVDGCDPVTGERRGRELLSPQADLILDGTINAPKSFSVAALVHPDLATEFEALQDRLRDRIIRTWQRELNARRGAAGRVREPLHRIEVVELQHRRSRALDPHIHRHLWLNVKVQGVDGRWSNVDSRVAMRLHTLINAEGELAVRTDPEWVTALARHGYTINTDGEIAELVHAVRPLSRRSNQIEANRASLLATWRTEHPGLEPDRDTLARIDRLAWAKNRPHKPTTLDEDDWEAMVRGELAAIDPALLHDATGTSAPAARDELDIDALAVAALRDADQRSAGSGGRFSMFDLRAGATRALAGSGVVADRDTLTPIIDAIETTAAEAVIDLLDGEGDRPEHVKGLMAPVTAGLKVELATRFDALTTPGTPIRREHIDVVAGLVLDGATLDDGQADATGAIAGTDRLVTVTGPAGAGKTTILRVANRALQIQKRRMVVVAPTKKAASVAGREIGTTGSSLHALLADHGFRWNTDGTGESWTRLRPGDADRSGRTYTRPTRYPLTGGDRIVVDEAGMVDLHAARALAVLAEETGAGVAMVGDPLQAMPVGHSGAMACMARRSTAVVELSTVHRFTDPAYAALTLRLREPTTRADALTVASELDAGGHLRVATDKSGARRMMVDAYVAAAASHRRIALVTATNEEADAVNELIQQHRIDHGQLALHRIAVGVGEQRILEGDLVQTRRNDTTTGVENRAVWTVRRIHADRIELASVSDSTDTRTVSTDYVADHVHLAYASTVHGIQGDTTHTAIVGPGVNAAGLYVGMTRGRHHNQAIVLAKPNQEPVETLADAMMRGIPEVTLDDGHRAARTELDRAARPTPDGDVSNRIEELARMEAWLATATRAIHDADSTHATQAACIHGREDAPEPGAANASLEQLRTAVAVRGASLDAIYAELVSAEQPLRAVTSVAAPPAMYAPPVDQSGPSLGF